MRSIVLSITICLTAVLLLAAPSNAQAITSQRIAAGLMLPVFVTHAPGDPYRLYVVEKPGRVVILDLRNLAAAPIIFLDITARVGGGASTFSERGLLGLAFHPQYQTNGLLYLDYTSAGAAGQPPLGDTIIARYTRSSLDTANPASEQIVLTVPQPAPNHNAGWLGFDPTDAMLLISLGDGGGQGDPFANAQNTLTLPGSILRIDIDATDGPTGAYGVPLGNPFVGAPGRDEIWAYGLRNPWRCSFDRATGDLYIADVGQSTWEELNVLPAASPGGENFGWPCFEGFAPFNTSGPCAAPPATTLPIHTYGHLVSPFGCSITGGYVYRGCAIPALDGLYFFADFCANQVWSLRPSVSPPGFVDLVNRTVELTPDLGAIGTIASFGEDSFGELYIVDLGGELFRVLPAAGITDCNANSVDDACEIAAGLVPDVNANGIPDTCGPCPGDANADRIVNFADITAVVANWLADYTAAPSGTGPGDADGSGAVNFADITTIVSNWLAPCP